MLLQLPPPLLQLPQLLLLLFQLFPLLRQRRALLLLLLLLLLLPPLLLLLLLRQPLQLLLLLGPHGLWARRLHLDPLARQHARRYHHADALPCELHHELLARRESRGDNHHERRHEVWCPHFWSLRNHDLQHATVTRTCK